MEEKKVVNLLKAAEEVLKTYSIFWEDVEWYGTYPVRADDKPERWPLDKIKTVLDVDDDPEYDRVRDDIVIVGYDAMWWMEYDTEWQEWLMFMPPLEPGEITENPWIWKKEEHKDEQ